MGLAQALDALISAGEAVQVHLRYMNEPIGPGKCEPIATPEWLVVGADDMRRAGPFDNKQDAEDSLKQWDTPTFQLKERANPTGLYRMLVPAAMQANQQSRPVKIVMPLIFSVADVVLIYEAPLNADGQKMVQQVGGPIGAPPPPPNGGGLIIGGR